MRTFVQKLLLSLIGYLALHAPLAAYVRNFWFELNALVLQPWEAGVVVTNKYAPVLTTTDFTESRALHPRFKWDWGYRIGVGFFFIPPNWNLELYWTNFETSASRTRSTDTNDATNLDQQGSFPIWNLGGDILPSDYISNSHLRWKLSINLLDMTFKRAFRFHRFALNPYFGLRSGWIRQKFNVHYSGGLFEITFLSPGVSINGDNSIAMRNDYWGIGPRIGIAPALRITHGLGIYADGAISALMGNFDKKQRGGYLESVNDFLSLGDGLFCV